MNDKNKEERTVGKGGIGVKSKETEIMTNSKCHEPSEKELILQTELEAVDLELHESRKRVEELRGENVWLQEEAARIRTENQEYMSYMDKKTSKRQSAVVSLSDYHRHQLMELQQQREIIATEFSTNKQALQAVLLQKENELTSINRELDGLQEYQTLYEDQRGQIAELEREMMELRNKHSQSIRDLKSSYVQEKRSFEESSQARLDSVAKQANKEALQCLSEHTTKVSEDNRRLRHELLTLIRQSQALHAHKLRLLAQRQELILECQYSEDLRAIRGRGTNNNNNAITDDKNAGPRSISSQSNRKDLTSISAANDSSNIENMYTIASKNNNSSITKISNIRASSSSTSQRSRDNVLKNNSRGSSGQKSRDNVQHSNNRDNSGQKSRDNVQHSNNRGNSGQKSRDNVQHSNNRDNSGSNDSRHA